MSEWVFALLVFAAQLIGWAFGRLLRRRLPAEHLSSGTRDSVMLLVGMVATLAALVLGLLISTAKTSFDADRASVVKIAADILLIDRALAHYGEEAKPSRDALRGFMDRAIEGMTKGREVDRSTVIREAILLAWRERQREELRMEAERLARAGVDVDDRARLEQSAHVIPGSTSDRVAIGGLQTLEGDHSPRSRVVELVHQDGE
jgi:Arc/MetJ-type ribon-helix-helix transcriptional regulator